MRYFLILLTVLSLSACSYSPEQLRNTYNELGKSYAKDIRQMADFSPAQNAEIDRFGQQLQQWHRQHRLPAYATLITHLGTQLQRNGYFTRQDSSQLINWMHKQPHIHEASAANYQLARLAQGLIEPQRTQIITDLRSEVRAETAAIRARTPEKRERQLVESIDNMMDYLGVELSKPQLDIVRGYAPKFHDLGEASITVHTRWYAGLENLLRQHKQADFPERFVRHMQLDNEHYLISQQEPKLVKANEEQATLMIQDLIASLNTKQKKTLAETLLSVGETFAEMVE